MEEFCSPHNPHRPKTLARGLLNQGFNNHKFDAIAATIIIVEKRPLLNRANGIVVRWAYCPAGALLAVAPIHENWMPKFAEHGASVLHPYRLPIEY